MIKTKVPPQQQAGEKTPIDMRIKKRSPEGAKNPVETKQSQNHSNSGEKNGNTAKREPQQGIGNWENYMKKVGHRH